MYYFHHQNKTSHSITWHSKSSATYRKYVLIRKGGSIYTHVVVVRVCMCHHLTNAALGMEPVRTHFFPLKTLISLEHAHSEAAATDIHSQKRAHPIQQLQQRNTIWKRLATQSFPKESKTEDLGSFFP